MTVEILRREFLLGLGAVAVLASEQSSAVVRGTLPAGVPDLSLPLNNLTNLIRMQSSLDSVDQTPWHYNGTLYYQKGSEQPIPMVSIEGMESYKVISKEDGSSSFVIMKLDGSTIGEGERVKLAFDFNNAKVADENISFKINDIILSSSPV